MSVTRSKTSDVIKKNIERPHLVPVVALIRIFGNADRNRMLDETVCIALPSDVALHLPTRGHFLITFERISSWYVQVSNMTVLFAFLFTCRDVQSRQVIWGLRTA